LTVQHLPRPKQLVRRKYRLKVGIKCDGLVQPTVNNYFKLGGGADWKITGSGIKRKVAQCTDVQTATGVKVLAAKRLRISSAVGHNNL
jgi:hypothetical protein